MEGCLFSALILAYCEEDELERVVGRLRETFGIDDRVRVVGGPFNIAIWTAWMERSKLLNLVAKSAALVEVDSQSLMVCLSIEKIDARKLSLN